MPKETTAHMDARLSAEEALLLLPEEEEFAIAGRAALSPAQNRLLSDVDVLQIIRGYQTYSPRLEETVKAFVMIGEWREKVEYSKMTTQNYALTQQFHDHWEERVYGIDKHGHIIIGFQFMEIDTGALAEYPEDKLFEVVAQKLATYNWYKGEVSKGVKQQRYKHIAIVDMAGASVGLLNGQRRKMVNKMTALATEMFPEALWKMYVINTPWYLRGAWAMTKPWLHPITQSKINICGDPADAFRKLKENDGCELDGLPAFLGGSHKGTWTYDLIQRAIESAARPTPSPTVHKVVHL